MIPFITGPSAPIICKLTLLDDDRAVLASDQASFARDDSAILDRGGMASSEHAVDRQVLVKVRQDLSSTRSRTPIAHQVANYREETDKLDTSALHAGVGGVSDELSGRTGAFDIGKDGVAFGTEGESEESSANVGHDSSDDNLFLAGCFDSCTELRVVPCAGLWSVRNTEEKDSTYLTSPWRRMRGASGYISIISFGSGPFGPVSAEVVRITGKSNSLPSSA